MYLKRGMLISKAGVDIDSTLAIGNSEFSGGAMRACHLILCWIVERYTVDHDKLLLNTMVNAVHKAGM